MGPTTSCEAVKCVSYRSSTPSNPRGRSCTSMCLATACTCDKILRATHLASARKRLRAEWACCTCSCGSAAARVRFRVSAGCWCVGRPAALAGKLGCLTAPSLPQLAWLFLLPHSYSGYGLASSQQPVLSPCKLAAGRTCGTFGLDIALITEFPWLSALKAQQLVLSTMCESKSCGELQLALPAAASIRHQDKQQGWTCAPGFSRFETGVHAVGRRSGSSDRRRCSQHGVSTADGRNVCSVQHDTPGWLHACRNAHSCTKSPGSLRAAQSAA